MLAGSEPGLEACVRCRTFLLAAVLIVVPFATPRPARASGADLGEAVQAKPDSARFLPRWMNASLEAGVSWMASPREVGDRYRAGVAFGGELVATAAPRLRLGLRFEYLDLPNGARGYLGTYTVHDSQAVAIPSSSYNGFHGGHTLDGLVVASVRPWRNLWLEAGGGYGYFSSGYPRVQFVDGTTGRMIDIPGQSGGGPALTAGLTYEFTVSKRDRLFAIVRWTRLERDGVSLDFVPLGLGYRFD